jgi:hypothetical protein
MTNQHPITPTPELVQQWSVSSPIQPSDESWAYELFIAHQAAQWGADRELEACIAFVRRGPWCSEKLRATRRPKPPTDKELAIRELGDAYDKGKIDDTIYDTIRKALEALPND